MDLYTRILVIQIPFICSSLIPNDVEHVFMYLSPIHVSSLLKSAKIFCQFEKLGCLLSYYFLESSLYILESKTLSDVFCQYFSPIFVFLFSY